MYCLLLAGSLLASSASDAKVYTDYKTATHAAVEAKKMLFLDIGLGLDFSQYSKELTAGFVLCQLSEDAQVTTGGKTMRLLEHSGFSDLGGQAGIAVVDYSDSDRLRDVVSVLPQRHVTAQRVRAIFELPPGSLTQRTLIWALRVHPENPRSVYGEPAPELFAHANRHSQVQASMNYQHHNLPLGIANKEIVAESWPWNKNVVDAALDIVDSWRQSPGHWGAACAACRYFGYDMKTNGHKWFATGVFR